MASHPIAVISFNRPQLLRAILESLLSQVPSCGHREITLFQDGSRSRFADRQVTDPRLIDDCVSVFRELIPTGQVHRSENNLGSPLNYERAERHIFETLEANAGIFLEDDLLLGPNYIDVLECLLERALNDHRIGYVAAFGHLQVSLAQQLLTPSLLRPLHLLWGFGLTRAHWLKMRPFVEEDLSVVETSDYQTRDVAAIRAMTTRWGIAAGDTSQDRIKCFATALVGATKLNTEVSYAKNIGEVGINFDKVMFSDWGLDKSEVATELATLDFDFENVVYDPWYEENNVWKLDTSPDELRFKGVARPTREEVYWLYCCILGRKPESEAVVDRQLTLQTFGSVREALVRSSEFIDEFGGFLQPVRVEPHQVNTSPFFDLSIGLQNVVYKPSKKWPTLGVISIVKDEEKNLGRMISSVIPIADYMVIVDTGSTDETLALAKSLVKAPRRIITIEFEDFSQARNLALDLVPQTIDWILVLDADEHLVAEDFQKIREMTLSKDVDGWALPRFNFVDEDKKKPVWAYPDYQKRLFRNLRENPARYVNKVHETIEGNLRWGFGSAMKQGEVSEGPHIHHTGWVGMTRERWLKKHKLYELLRRNP